MRTQWVKGHSGHEHNERCDVLAAQAISLGTGTASRVASPPASAPKPAPELAPKIAAAALQTAAALGTTWTLLSKPEPEGQTVLYGLLHTDGAAPTITRAETGSRTGTVRDKPWATHWMAIPAYLPG